MQGIQDRITSAEITIVGLGPGSGGELTLEALEALESAENLYLRTMIHPTVEFLREKGINFESFDDIYETRETFEEIYSGIVEKLMAEAIKGKRITYAVPGNPLIGEDSVHMLVDAAKKRGIPVRIIGGVSFLSPLLPILGLDPLNGLTLVDGAQLDLKKLNPSISTVIAQLYNDKIAADVKLTLMEVYPDEHRVLLIRAAGIKGEERAEWLPLYEIDRVKWIDHLTSLYVPPLSSQRRWDKDRTACKWPLDPLVEIMEILRSENGCPWDKEQTARSLRPYVIEEAYEVVEAIDGGSPAKLREELGDLLLQVVFHAQIGREEGTFDMNSIIETIVEKMLRRHPHVFGDMKIETAQGVLMNWEKIKKAERGTDETESILDGIPRNLPALALAYKVQKKAARVGFDWEDIEGPIKKAIEEIGELKEAIERFSQVGSSHGKEEDDELSNSSAEMEEEFGDLLFAMVNMGRFLKIEPELALRRAVNKFCRRFREIEKEAKRRGTKLEDLSLSEMDEIWEKSKKR